MPAGRVAMTGGWGATVTLYSGLILCPAAVCALACHAEGLCGCPLGEFLSRPWGWVVLARPSSGHRWHLAAAVPCVTWEEALSLPGPTARWKELVSVTLCSGCGDVWALLRSRVLSLSASRPFASTSASDTRPWETSLLGVLGRKETWVPSPLREGPHIPTSKW